MSEEITVFNVPVWPLLDYESGYYMNGKKFYSTDRPFECMEKLKRQGYRVLYMHTCYSYTKEEEEVMREYYGCK
jgi:hypothetical protein